MELGRNRTKPHQEAAPLKDRATHREAGGEPQASFAEVWESLFTRKISFNHDTNQLRVDFTMLNSQAYQNLFNLMIDAQYMTKTPQNHALKARQDEFDRKWEKERGPLPHTTLQGETNNEND